MRFLMYTMGDDTQSPIAPPSPELMQEMGKFVQEATASGALIATGGVAPMAEGITVDLKGGKFSVTDGPYAESKELIGGWALIEAQDKDEAVDWAKRFLSILGEGESRIRQVF